MRLDYMAHSCFLLEHDGFRLLFDPYDPCIGYPVPRLYSVDLIVVSHDHRDHNGVSHISGASQIVRGVARREFGPVVVDGEVGWHGEGSNADPVALTLLEWDGRRLAHFGDLGRQLDKTQLDRFQGLDLLMIPVGGGYTIDGRGAAQIVKQLKPRIVVPMHFQTPFLNREQFPGFQTAEPFEAACRDFCQMTKIREGWVDLDEAWVQPNRGEAPTVLHLQHQMA
jgi:L-ascorbate metabolism protein UlaG (beta-lactamase superfamily)